MGLCRRAGLDGSGGPFGGLIPALPAATFVANRLGGGLFRDWLLLPLVTAVACRV